jgi:hypothetical protein
VDVFQEDLDLLDLNTKKNTAATTTIKQTAIPMGT